MHGGISPKLQTINDIRRISLPFEEPAPDSLEQDLLWADPSLNQNGFQPNTLREVSLRNFNFTNQSIKVSVSFGEDMVRKLCKKNNLDLIVRAHQMMPNGYGFFASRKCVTVFSAPRYQPDLNNRGGLMVIDKNMCISFLILNPVDDAKLAGKVHFQRTFNDTSALSSTKDSVTQ